MGRRFEEGAGPCPNTCSTIVECCNQIPCTETRHISTMVGVLRRIPGRLSQRSGSHRRFCCTGWPGCGQVAVAPLNAGLCRLHRVESFASLQTRRRIAGSIAHHRGLAIHSISTPSIRKRHLQKHSSLIGLLSTAATKLTNSGWHHVVHGRHGVLCLEVSCRLRECSVRRPPSMMRQRMARMHHVCRRHVFSGVHHGRHGRKRRHLRHARIRGSA